MEKQNPTTSGCCVYHQYGSPLGSCIGNYYFDADIIMHEGTVKKLDAERSKELGQMIDPKSDSFWSITL